MDRNARNWPRGGAAVWHTAPASGVLLGEFFGSAAGVGGLVLSAGAISQSEAPGAGDVKIYLNAGSLFGKTTAGAGDALARLVAGSLTTG